MQDHKVREVKVPGTDRKGGRQPLRGKRPLRDPCVKGAGLHWRRLRYQNSTVGCCEWQSLCGFTRPRMMAKRRRHQRDMILFKRKCELEALDLDGNPCGQEWLGIR